MGKLHIDRLPDPEWPRTRPPAVRALLERYPPGRYRVKPGAPYRFTPEGVIVSLYSYTEHGEVGVVVLESSPAADFALAIAKTEAAHYDHTLHAAEGPCCLERVAARETVVGLGAHVAPRWLELVEVAEACRAAWDPDA